MSDKKFVIVKNVELCWAFLAEPCTKGEYASGKYQVDIILNEDQKHLLETLQFSNKQKIKDLGEGRYGITLKSTVKPQVVDNNKMPMTDEAIGKIGNGTIANVRVVAYESRGATFLGLSSVRVKSLVEYAGGCINDLFDDDEVSPASDLSDDDDDLA